MKPCLLVLLVAVAAGCDAGLPTPERTDPPPSVRLELTPAADPAAIAPVTHARLLGAGRSSPDASGVALVMGKAGPRHVDQIATGALSDALAGRIVPTRVWVDGPDVVVAPLVPLTGGERYDLVLADREAVFSLVVDPSSAAPLVRVWPPDGQVIARAAAVYCAEVAIDMPSHAGGLLPDGPAGTFAVGSPAGGAERCVRFEASDEDSEREGEWLPPPVVAGDVPLAAGAIVVGPASGLPPATCGAREVPIGPGCARVEDDRLFVVPPDAPVLWVIETAGVQAVFATADGAEMVVKGLPPASAVTLSVETLDLSGVWSHVVLEVETQEPRARFVLNEVYANPIGPEPAQEWVEIVNDGAAGGSLDGFIIGDVGGETLLPDVTVAAGGLAVVVNESFDASGEYDAPIADGAIVIRVPKLGKNGLGNSGEPLKLVGPRGGVVSRVPAAPKPKPGASVARRKPEAPDTEASFVSDPAPTPGLPNDSSGDD